MLTEPAARASATTGAGAAAAAGPSALQQPLPADGPGDVAVDGARLRCHVAGARRRRRATPVLLLPGVPDDTTGLAALGAACAADRAAVVGCLPGLGGSELTDGYDRPSLARAVIGLALEVGELCTRPGPVDLVGHDWGGVAALAAAAERPDLVRRVVLINAPFRRLLPVRAAHIPFFATPVVPELALRALGGRAGDVMVRAAWGPTGAPPDTLRHAAAGYLDPQRRKAMLSYYRAAVRGARTPVGPVRVEAALVVWGSADPVLPAQVADMAVQDLRADGTPAELFSVPRAGHWPHLVAPEAVAEAVTAFLRRP